MAAAYRDLLTKVRLAFPQPVSDRVHDSYFFHSIMRALDQVDGMKSQLPFLGRITPIDYQAGQQAHLYEQPQPLEDVAADLVSHLAGPDGRPHLRAWAQTCGLKDVISLATSAGNNYPALLHSLDEVLAEPASLKRFIRDGNPGLGPAEDRLLRKRMPRLTRGLGW